MKHGQAVVESGPRGAASVTTTNKSVRVKLDNTNLVFEFPKDKAPEYARTGKFNVRISEDNSTLLGMSPINGSEVVRFERFTGPKDTPPAPKINTKPGKRRDGGEYPRTRLTFNALLKIIEGPNAGMSLILPLTYREKNEGFAKADDGINTQVVGNKPAAQELIAFLDASGAWDVDFPFSENVLPILQEVLLRQNRAFKVNLKGGWIKSCEKVDQTPPKKKSK